MTIGLDLVVLIAGLLMMAFSQNPKVGRIGEMMFFCGMLALLLGGDRIVALFK